MNQNNQPKTHGKSLNFFPAPHQVFDDKKFKDSLSHTERDFFMTLCHLSNRVGKADGWFGHCDRTFTDRKGKQWGFENYGFSRSTCRRVRKKLTDLGLIETKAGTTERGHWAGTMYRINPQLLKNTGVHDEARPGTIENPGPGPP